MPRTRGSHTARYIECTKRLERRRGQTELRRRRGDREDAARAHRDRMREKARPFETEPPNHPPERAAGAPGNEVAAGIDAEAVALVGGEDAAEARVLLDDEDLRAGRGEQ